MRLLWKLILFVMVIDRFIGGNKKKSQSNESQDTAYAEAEAK